MRKQIQEKLIKFATRVPIFMYLTDYRERSLKDVITQLEPGLFKKVTGLDVKDFNLLCSIGVFNASLMNDAIFKFKRYEDSSLSYTGIDKHAGGDIGGWDTVIRREEYEKLFYNQQATMNAPERQEFIEVLEQVVEEVAEEPIVIPESKKTVVIQPKINTVASQYGVKPTVKPQTTPEDPIPNVKVGDVITHKTFGKGTVTRLDKATKHIRVKFTVGEKNFIFPDAFKMGFLKQ